MVYKNIQMVNQNLFQFLKLLTSCHSPSYMTPLTGNNPFAQTLDTPSCVCSNQLLKEIRQLHLNKYGAKMLN